MQKVVRFLLIFMPILFFASPCTALTCFASNGFNVLQIQKYDDIEYTTNTPFLIHKFFFSKFDAKLCFFDKSTSNTLCTISFARAENSGTTTRALPTKSKSKNSDVAVSGYMYLLVLLVTLPVLAVALILIIPRKTNLLIDKQNAKAESKKERVRKIKDDEML